MHDIHSQELYLSSKEAYFLNSEDVFKNHLKFVRVFSILYWNISYFVTVSCVVIL